MLPVRLSLRERIEVRVRYGSCRTQNTVAEDSRPQTAPPFEKFFRARNNRAIHPITWPALLHSMKANALHFKILSNQAVKIDIARVNVSPHRARRNSLHLQCAAKVVENSEREKGDLPFVIRLEVEITIASQPAAGHAFDHRHFDHRKFVRLLSVVSDKVMPGRDVKMTDFHRA